MVNESFSVNKNSVESMQNIILENRNKLSISGVKDVFSFDDQMVILETDLGLLTIKGEDIRISKLSLDTTEIMVEGNICSLTYSDRTEKKSSGTILGKIFK